MNGNIREPWMWPKISCRDQILAGQSLAADRAALSWQGRSGAGGRRVRHARDVMLASLEALGHPEGNYKLFCAGGAGMTRRKFALLSGAAAVGAYGGIKLQKAPRSRPSWRDGPAGKSAVAIIRAQVVFRRPGLPHAGRHSAMRPGRARQTNPAETQPGGV